MRTLTPWQYAVIALARGVESLRADRTPPPDGFEALFDGLKVAARVDFVTQADTDAGHKRTHPDDGLMKFQEVADELRVSERTVRRYVADGRLQSVEVGLRCVRIPRADLDAFVKEGRR